ncbi:MAG: hypothetical protein IJ111_08415, partial [Eggerthellaceae bacterium]|nr:hypothetical protein [Eggerthellaceae bacterium]
MNGFNCTFNDLRHTFATMMIAKGTDIRTVSDWLEKMKACFDVDMDGVFGKMEPKREEPPASGIAGLTFTVEQLELMLAEARRREKGAA